MPNWVVNRVVFTGDVKNIKKVTDTIKGDNGDIDFNSLIPMPEDIYTGDLDTDASEKYGDKNWYDWSIDNWGTKWNASEPWCSGNELRFDTAWNTPRPIYCALAKLCKKHNITYKADYCDEDILGGNCGTFTCDKEGRVAVQRPSTEQQMNEYGKSLWGYDALAELEDN